MNPHVHMHIRTCIGYLEPLVSKETLKAMSLKLKIVDFKGQTLEICQVLLGTLRKSKFDRLLWIHIHLLYLFH